jgi:hypothetical protein
MQLINIYRRKIRNNKGFQKTQTSGTGINNDETAVNFKI